MRSPVGVADIESESSVMFKGIFDDSVEIVFPQRFVIRSHIVIEQLAEITPEVVIHPLAVSRHSRRSRNEPVHAIMSRTSDIAACFAEKVEHFAVFLIRKHI